MISQLKKNIQEKLDYFQMNSSELERKAGLSSTSVRKILLGNSQNPTLETLKAIADVFDCSLDELVGRRILEESNSAADDFIKKTDLKTELFLDIVHKSCECACQKNQQLKLNDFIDFILQAYKYCLMKKNGIVDNEFIDWYFNETFK
ncbi:MAG: helix-turn-helix transcriptional regulator [Proteobacteria bacterium]|nr:helix-turn-helix transcriptional regulator [Pseudomonadota bacterium]